MQLPETLLDEYTSVPANNPANTRHGGVVLFYKNSFPVVVRTDLCFDQSGVIELKSGRKNICYCFVSKPLITILLIFEPFCLILEIKAENHFSSFFTGDFNAHSQYWWPVGDSTPEGTEIEHLLTLLDLSQVISEPANFEPSKNPSCIDLVITDQPYLILDSGTHDS